MYQSQTLHEALENIENLKKNGLSNILLTDDLEEISSKKDSFLSFYAEDGMLKICNRWGIPMLKKEMEQVISFLKYTVENIDEDYEINMQVKEVEEEIKKLREPIKPKPKVQKKGYVYLIKGENCRFKIGYSKNPTRRVQELSLASCECHSLIKTVFSKEPKKLEESLHNKFKNKKTHSEWFSLDNKDVDYIMGLSDEI